MPQVVILYVEIQEFHGKLVKKPEVKWKYVAHYEEWQK